MKQQMIPPRYLSQVSILPFISIIVCDDIMHWLVLFPLHQSILCVAILFACGHFIATPTIWNRICGRRVY
jgi:hypothetical protein